MRMNLEYDLLDKTDFLIGKKSDIIVMRNIPNKEPFSCVIQEFLQNVSRFLMRDLEAKKYSDVISFAYWIRKASICDLKDKYYHDDIGILRMGRGVVFHISPSNVPVIFAYSLVLGLICGNANIVRVPSKKYPQVSIIISALNKAIEMNTDLAPYIVLMRYERDRNINDLLSSLCDVRMIWGGDDTINAVRESNLPPRSIDVTFADRYSLAVIDSDMYMEIDNKRHVAEEFYNDTYYNDQNACTSPCVVIWVGRNITESKKIFWDTLHELVVKEYKFHSIQAVNKLTNALLAVAEMPGSYIETKSDNFIYRINLSRLDKKLVNFKCSGGFFFEYECKNIMELYDICSDKRCQTIGYLGDYIIFLPLISSGIKGVDRIVPIGKTMDFNLVWDGYNLCTLLTRSIYLQ